MTGEDSALTRSLVDWIAAREDRLVDLLREMIRTRSVNPGLDPGSAGEGAMAELVRSRYAALGIPVETVEAAPGRPNLIARWEGTGGGPRLLVNCHLDTQPADLGEWLDPFTGAVVHEWTRDAFGGDLDGGVVFGRGAADHKSPIAATLFALEALRAHGVRPRGTLTCIHDADEETGGRLGMRHLAACLPFDYDMALYACTSEVTERGQAFFPPMGASNVVRAFAGGQTYRVRVAGLNLHSLTPASGLGAAEAALLLLDQLRPLLQRVNEEPSEGEAGGHPRMRISGIDSGPRAALHHQARTCDITINRRLPPGTDPEAAVAELQAVVDAHCRAHPENPAELEVLRSLPPFTVAPDHPLVEDLVRAVRAVTGEEPAVVGVPASVGISELLVRHPIPTVLFGYGVLNLHHAIDEHISTGALVRTAQVYAVAFAEWLGVAFGV
jgi:acetylornithine deacetylase/succinyl-diaminopimelate desuccinylase-like protein